MGQFLRIVIATTDEASRETILRVAGRHQSARVVAEVDTNSKFRDAMALRRPQLAFVSADFADMKGFEAADWVSRRYPGLYITMIASRHNVEDVRRAMKAGARECLFEPLEESEVVRVIEEARSLSTTAAAERMGIIVTVMSSKGGVGKSTIAVNLAIALKQLGAGRVALVDGDLYFGDAATMLNITPERTIHELNASLDAEIVDRFLHQHSSGIEVLAAPLAAEQAEEISPDRFRDILSMLRTLYDYIVVDSSITALDTMLATLDVADLALVLSTLDVVCLKDVTQVIDMLNKLQFPTQNIAVVANRFDERFSLNPKDAERALGVRFAAVVPRDDQVVVAANRGVPSIVGEPGAAFSQKVLALAKVVTQRIGRTENVPA